MKFGIAPEAVGKAIGEIPNSTLAPYEAMLWANDPESEGKLKSKVPSLLVKVGDSWRVKKASEIQSVLKPVIQHGGSDKGIFIINLATVCDAIFQGLYDYWSK